MRFYSLRRKAQGLAQELVMAYLARIVFLVVGSLCASLCTFANTAPSPQGSPPPHYSFSHILPDQVAAIGYINTVAQDSEGFMWFGGANGLARYDGYNLVIYRRDAVDTHSLSNNYVNDIHLSREGQLWIATRNGINHYDATLDRFTRYQIATDSELLSSDDIMAIEETEDGRFWLASRGGLYSFDRTSHQFQLHSLESESSSAAEGLL